MPPRMTTSSYAVLGLLSLRPWSAYDLARQAERSLRFAWPKSERHLYSEPKKLVTLGHATVRDEPAGPNRTRQVYSITDQGRKALEEWVRTEPAPPVFEAEALVRLLFAESGSIEDLIRSLQKFRADAEELHTWSREILAGYVSGGDVPFPDRLHLSVLLATFEAELLTMIERWTDFAIEEIGRWDSTDRPGAGDHAIDDARRIVRGESVIDRT